MPPRIAFITIGQSPRDDILPEILPLLPRDLDWREFGVMDDLSRADIAAGAAVGTEDRLVSRLRDGTEVTVGKAWLLERLQALIDRLDDGSYHVLVLLCTGDFGGLRSRTLLLEAQGILDGLTDALADGKRKVGIMVPLREQKAEFSVKPLNASGIAVAHASPYGADRLDAAVGELADSDLIVMHCLGYDEAMRSAVAQATRKPVLLARRALAGAIAQIL